jgi:hypothetical protein
MARQTPVYVYDLLATVVGLTATAVGISPIHYTYGSGKEIVEKMVAMSKDPQVANPKYPLIALITDVIEERGLSTAIYTDATCHIVIANLTESQLLAEDRIAGNFKTVLYPIYEEFLYQLYKCHLFDIEESRLIRHRKIDRLDFGRSQFFSEAGLGADFIDAIELQNMVLKVKKYNCLTHKI